MTNARHRLAGSASEGSLRAPASAADASCAFRCTVSVEHPSVLMKAAALLTFFPYFVVRHDREETRLFAESLAEHAGLGPNVVA